MYPLCSPSLSLSLSLYVSLCQPSAPFNPQAHIFLHGGKQLLFNSFTHTHTHPPTHTHTHTHTLLRIYYLSKVTHTHTHTHTHCWPVGDCCSPVPAGSV